jgi:hypothetical protein
LDLQADHSLLLPQPLLLLLLLTAAAVLAGHASVLLQQ